MKNPKFPFGCRFKQNSMYLYIGNRQTCKKIWTLLGAGTKGRNPSASAWPPISEIMNWSMPPNNSGHSPPPVDAVDTFPFGLSFAENYSDYFWFFTTFDNIASKRKIILNAMLELWDIYI